MTCTRTRAAVAAGLALGVIGLTGASAGWQAAGQVGAQVSSAAFAYPGGAAGPPAPEVLVGTDGDVSLRWPQTVLSGADARPMTGYVVLGLQSSGEVVEVACPTQVDAGSVSCLVPAASAAGLQAVAVRPRYHGWVGALSSSAVVPAASPEPPPADGTSTADGGTEPAAPTAPAPHGEPAPEDTGADGAPSDGAPGGASTTPAPGPEGLLVPTP